MQNTLRLNDVLLIVDRAFQPFQCVAWAPQAGSGELSLSVIDRAHTALLGRTLLTANTYSDPTLLANVLQQSREQLSQQGYALEPWCMPA
jgi:hypothetical protein